jgi:molecular chaperone GrpE
MFEVEGKDSESGKISEVVQDGYTIGDRLLRPAMVGVFKSKKI